MLFRCFCVFCFHSRLLAPKMEFKELVSRIFSIFVVDLPIFSFFHFFILLYVLLQVFSTDGCYIFYIYLKRSSYILIFAALTQRENSSKKCHLFVNCHLLVQILVSCHSYILRRRKVFSIIAQIKLVRLTRAEAVV